MVNDVLHNSYFIAFSVLGGTNGFVVNDRDSMKEHRVLPYYICCGKKEEEELLFHSLLLLVSRCIPPLASPPSGPCPVFRDVAKASPFLGNLAAFENAGSDLL